MEWWDRVQPYLVFGLFVLLLAAGVLARRWTRRFASKAQANLDSGAVHSLGGDSMAVRQRDELRTVLRFPVPAEVVAPALAGMTLALLWTQTGPQRWHLPVARGAEESAAIVVLEEASGGSQLALTRAEESAGVILTDASWRKIRRNAARAAAAAGIQGFEALGPELMRVPLADVTGMTPAQTALVKHRWERPAAV